jgi:hypothetical protein
MCTGFVQNYAGLIVMSLLLGAAEGCIFLSLSLFLLNWYKCEEIRTQIVYIFGIYEENKCVV